MPKFDVTFRLISVMDVEAEDTPTAALAALEHLRDCDLPGAVTLVKIIRTDPPLSAEAYAEANEPLPEQPGPEQLIELPAPITPVNCAP